MRTSELKNKKAIVVSEKLETIFNNKEFATLYKVCEVMTKKEVSIDMIVDYGTHKFEYSLEYTGSVFGKMETEYGILFECVAGTRYTAE